MAFVDPQNPNGPLVNKSLPAVLDGLTAAAGDGKTSLIQLSHAAYAALYDVIHACEIAEFPVNIYVMRQFARLYLNDELTFADLEQVAKEYGPSPVMIFAGFPKSAVIQDKYRQHNADERAIEHYTRIAQAASALYFGADQVQ